MLLTRSRTPCHWASRPHVRAQRVRGYTTSNKKSDDTANLPVEPLLCSSTTKCIEAKISGFYSMGKSDDKNKEELCKYLNQALEKNLEKGKIVEILRYSQDPMTNDTQVLLLLTKAPQGSFCYPSKSFERSTSNDKTEFLPTVKVNFLTKPKMHCFYCDSSEHNHYDCKTAPKCDHCSEITHPRWRCPKVNEACRSNGQDEDGFQVAGGSKSRKRNENGERKDAGKERGVAGREGGSGGGPVPGAVQGRTTNQFNINSNSDFPDLARATTSAPVQQQQSQIQAGHSAAQPQIQSQIPAQAQAPTPRGNASASSNLNSQLSSAQVNPFSNQAQDVVSKSRSDDEDENMAQEEAETNSQL